MNRIACAWCLGALLFLHCTPPDRPAAELPVETSPPECVLGERPPGLLMAGSGSNLALTRMIAERYLGLHPGQHIHIPPSIGTSGAIQAVLDGVVDIGLASRPLQPRERSAGLVEIPWVTVGQALVASDDVALTRITPTQLIALLRGELPPLAGGPRLVPLLREPGDSGNEVFAQQLPGFREALAEATRSNRWRVCITDQEMEQAILHTPGAIGLLDLGTLRLGVLRRRAHPVILEGFPEPPGVGAPLTDYPLRKRLSFVTRGRPSGTTADFLAYSRAPENEDLLREGGYTLLPWTDWEEPAPSGEAGTDGSPRDGAD